MSIAEVVAGLGVEARDGEEVVLTTIGLGGEVENWTLAECGQWPEAWEGNVYQGSGVFRRGSVTRHAGRKGANVVRTLWLPFDADLKDFMNQSTEDVLALDDATIERTIGYLREDMEEAFAALGLPIHRLDYTGHGLCAYVYLDEEAGRAVEHIPGLHKRLIRAINAKYRLVDPEVSDAGSRITRLPGSRNYKAVERGLGPARQTRTLYHRPGAAGVRASRLRRPRRGSSPTTASGWPTRRRRRSSTPSLPTGPWARSTPSRWPWPGCWPRPGCPRSRPWP
jgi:hypothetical protein